MQESVSLELRRKRARKMRALSVRLHKLKRNKMNRLASAATLKTRARKVARQMLRKKLAGRHGKNYANLNTAQKMAVDRLVDQAPKAKLKAIAKRLVPFVTRAEHSRLADFRKSKSKVTEAVSEGVSHKQRMERIAAAQRSAHKRKAGTGFVQNRHRENKGGLGRKLNRQARLELLKQQSGSLAKGNSSGAKYANAAKREMLVNRPGRLAAIKSRVKQRKSSSRGKRADLQRRSKRDFNRYDVAIRGFASLRSSFEDEFAMVLAEGKNKKFEQLFIRGLVPRNKVEHYKRIFDDVPNNIRLRRYQADIAKILNDLVEMITSDDFIYRRTRLNLLKKRWK